MRAEDFFLLINEIDDGLVVESEGEKKSPERRFSFAGILPAAAILAGIIAGIFVIISIRMNGVREHNHNCFGNSGVIENVSSVSSVSDISSVSSIPGSSVSKPDVSTNSDNPPEPPMFFKEPQPEDIVFDAEHGVSYVKNQLLISAELGAPEEEMQRIFDELGAEVVGFIELTNDYQIEFKTDKTLAELEAAANYIDSFSFVQGVTLNLILDINYDL